MPQTPNISQITFETVTGLLLGLALILALSRTYTRVRKFHRIFVDDGILFLAVTTLVASSVMIYVDFPYVYLQDNAEANLVQQLVQAEKNSAAINVLLITTIFSVKFVFLAFFRTLLQRLHGPIIVWWWVVLAIVILSTGYSIVSTFVACPVFGEAAFEVCVTPRAIARQNASGIADTVLDVVTDVLLISIPICLLWRVQIHVRRKIILLFNLCLSIFMIIISIITVIPLNTSSNEAFTQAWVLFWSQIEAEIAVIVVSISAFRSLFASSPSDPTRASPQWKLRFNNTPRVRRLSSGEELPSIPSATFTGIRSFIRNIPHSGMTLKTYEEHLSIGRPGIEPTHDTSMQRGATSEEGMASHNDRPSYESVV
ncbi:hypothetical protein MMC20_006099 [Loxospora ochrophaea]|nr:hypothetical protein [Loxospora ochrophaea]